MASALKLLFPLSNQSHLLKRQVTFLSSCYLKKNTVLLLNHSKALSTANVTLLSNKQNQQEDTRESFWRKLFPFINNSQWKVYPQYFVIKNLKPDKVSSAYKMVYRSELETYANFGMVAAGLLSAAFPAAFYKYFVLEELTSLHMAELSIFCVGGALTIAAIYFLCTKVPLRVYYSQESDNYLVYLPSVIPYKTHKLLVKPGELIPPMNHSEYLPWVALEHIHVPTGQKLLVNAEQFTPPLYYNKLLRK